MWALGGEVVRVRGIIARHCSCEARQDTHEIRDSFEFCDVRFKRFYGH